MLGHLAILDPQHVRTLCRRPHGRDPEELSLLPAGHHEAEAAVGDDRAEEVEAEALERGMEVGEDRPVPGVAFLHPRGVAVVDDPGDASSSVPAPSGLFRSS